MQDIKTVTDLSGGLFIRSFIESQFSLLPRAPGHMKRFIKTNLPYSVHPSGRRGEYIALNREYKPLGWSIDRSAFIDYSDPMWSPFCFYPASDHVYLDDGFAVLYGNGSEPWRDINAMFDYVDRLGDLFGCDVDRMRDIL